MGLGEVLLEGAGAGGFLGPLRRLLGWGDSEEEDPEEEEVGTAWGAEATAAAVGPVAEVEGPKGSSIAGLLQQATRWTAGTMVKADQVR